MTDRLELYKVMVGTITATEQRRQQSTTVNTSLVVAAMAALGGIKGIDPMFFALPAIPLCLIWLLNIRYFRRIAAAKWKVVIALESKFDAQPFGDEWAILMADTKRLRFELTHLEMAVPISILVASLGYLVFRFCNIGL